MGKGIEPGDVRKYQELMILMHKYPYLWLCVTFELQSRKPSCLCHHILRQSS